MAKAKEKAYAAKSGNLDEFVASEPKLTVLTDHALRHEEVSKAFEHDPFNFRYKFGPVYDILLYKDPRDGERQDTRTPMAILIDDLDRLGHGSAHPDAAALIAGALSCP